MRAHKDKELKNEIPINFALLTLFRFSERRKFAPESGGFNTGCGVRRWSPELPAHSGSAARVAGGRLWAETCGEAAIGAPNGKQG